GQLINTAVGTPSGSRNSFALTVAKYTSSGIFITGRTAYQGPMIPTTSSLPPVVERETEATKDTVPPTNNESTEDIQSLVVQTESPILNSKLVIAPIIKPVVAPDSAPKPNKKLSIPYPSRLHDQKLRDKANDQKEKFFQTFKDLNFNISFAKRSYSDAKKLPKKLGDPGKFLIPCDFPRMAECLALADLGASINLMSLFVWNKLSLPELTPTLITLKLADRSISRPIGVAEDVYVKVGKFHFSPDFVVVDFDADPQAITFNLDQTSRYSANYNDMTANRIDVIDMACEEYSQEVLGFSDVIVSGNPTPYYDLIVFTSSPTLTPFGDSDFLLEEVDAFLALEDDATSPEELKICKAKTDKSLIDEPPEVELKDLPPHLEYAFLEGDDKLPVIIAKNLSVEVKTALITVLKSHKRAIAWKLSDIKDQEKTTFTCPYGTFAYRRMPFGLCNAPGTFQRCMMAIFHDMIEKTMEVFMDDFSVFGNSFQTCLSHLEKMLKRGDNNDDDESSNDDDDDDDVEKGEEDKEEDEHLAPADPSDVSTDDLIMLATRGSGKVTTMKA
nr:hypothetical protein [Tanacetum cinerariifolium]